ncbi:unnamed protein product [Parnassius apollo]|uniref:(apollo) hypothetical protein n=1 Tax=Parnassius apollo TaxID=110799 RepID=A0A8S3WJ78_PARAO|nr:unnamed protein product [Parnassius apollo]
MQTFVDPTHFGNIGRYVNHSCDPNCYIVPVRINSPIPKLAIFSLCDILPDQEITIDYGANNCNYLQQEINDGDCKRKKCLCNTNKCKERPFLWGKTEDIYKDKNLKLAAWREVCLILKPNFDELDEKERKQYGKQVSTKLNNIRDSWLKTVKKQKDESKSGSSTKKTRNYLYHEQLMFLKKVSEPRPPHESVSKKARTETEVGMESDFRSPLVKDKRKIDNKEVNDRMVKFLDSRINPEKENHVFLQRHYTNLEHFNYRRDFRISS